MNKMVSLIVPVFNAEKYLRNSLDSIVAQTYKDYEVWLIDDGSTDNSGSICDAYAKKDGRFHVIHQKNQGVSVARNVGLEHAGGDYIGFMDSDDWVEPTIIETLCGNMPEGTDRPDIAMCCLYFGNKAFYPLNRRDDARYDGEEALCFVLSDRYSSLCCKLFRRAVIEEKKLRFDPELTMCEDLLFIFEYLQGGTLQYHPEPLYHYRMSENSASRTDFSPKRLSLLKAMSKIERQIPEDAVKVRDAYRCKFAYNNLVMLIQLLISPHPLNDQKAVKRQLRGNIRENLGFFLRSPDYSLFEKLTACALVIWPEPVAWLYGRTMGKK